MGDSASLALWIPSAWGVFASVFASSGFSSRISFCLSIKGQVIHDLIYRGCDSRVGLRELRGRSVHFSTEGLSMISWRILSLDAREAIQLELSERNITKHSEKAIKQNHEASKKITCCLSRHLMIMYCIVLVLPANPGPGL